MVTSKTRLQQRRSPPRQTCCSRTFSRRHRRHLPTIRAPVRSASPKSWCVTNFFLTATPATDATTRPRLTAGPPQPSMTGLPSEPAPCRQLPAVPATTLRCERSKARRRPETSHRVFRRVRRTPYLAEVLLPVSRPLDPAATTAPPIGRSALPVTFAADKSHRLWRSSPRQRRLLTELFEIDCYLLRRARNRP